MIGTHTGGNILKTPNTLEYNKKRLDTTKKNEAIHLELKG